jgi:hypothetical protein
MDYLSKKRIIDKWRPSMGCTHPDADICACKACIEIEQAIKLGAQEAYGVLKNHINTKEGSPEKDAMTEVLSRLEFMIK